MFFFVANASCLSKLPKETLPKWFCLKGFLHETGARLLRSSRGFQGHGGHVLSSHPGEYIRKTQNAPRWRKETPRKCTCISVEHSQGLPPAKIRIFAVGNGPYGCFARSSAQARAQPTREAVILCIFLMQAQLVQGVKLWPVVC